jgi:Tol biopolymer transport system component
MNVFQAVKILKTLLLAGLALGLLAPWQGVDAARQAAPAEVSSSRVSVASDGGQGNSHSDSPSISGDGRYVAFTSYASNLVPDDTNEVQDVFVHDRRTGKTRRVSVASNGEQADKSSTSPCISADGRFVAFTSYATNLAPVTGVYGNVFVHNLLTGSTELIPAASGELANNKGVLEPSISADGRFVAFTLYLFYDDPIDPVGDDWERTLYVYDRSSGSIRRITPPLMPRGDHIGESAFLPHISADGRYVAFASSITKLLVTGDNNFKEDIFVADLQNGGFRRVSVGADGVEANDHSYTPAISGDGQRVVFMSAASNLVAGDTNGLTDIFVHDLGTGQTRRVSVSAEGVQTNKESSLPVISANGQYVAFQSNASTLVEGDVNNTLDVFLTQLSSGQVRLVSLAFDGAQGNKQSLAPALSSDASFVAFGSSANNLVTGDTNNARDVFVNGGLDVFRSFLPLVMK